MSTKKAKAKSGSFSAEERAAMKERAQELKRAARPGKADGEADLLAKIAEMEPPDRAMARHLHELIKAHAPTLSSRTWYGMPAWAQDGEVICFFQGARKFKTRYSTLGFSDKAKLDDGAMWATSFALESLSAAGEKRIITLLKKAIG